MKKPTFNAIQCKKSTNLPGNDDVFLMVQVDGGPPIRYPVYGTIEMNDGDTVNFPAGGESNKPVFYFEHVLSVTVWDHDGPANFLNEADLLGCTRFFPDYPSNVYGLHGVDSSHYVIGVDIEDANLPASVSGQDLPYDLQSAAADAVLSWAQTKEGKAALKEDDPEKLSDLLSKGIASKVFDTVIELVRKIPVIKAVSLGLMGQVSEIPLSNVERYGNG